MFLFPESPNAGRLNTMNNVTNGVIHQQPALLATHRKRGKSGIMQLRHNSKLAVEIQT
jgi:hypothetical protein